MLQVFHVSMTTKVSLSEWNMYVEYDFLLGFCISSPVTEKGFVSSALWHEGNGKGAMPETSRRTSWWSSRDTSRATYGGTCWWKFSLVGHMCCWAWPDSLSLSGMMLSVQCCFVLRRIYCFIWPPLLKHEQGLLSGEQCYCLLCQNMTQSPESENQNIDHRYKSLKKIFEDFNHFLIMAQSFMPQF